MIVVDDFRTMSLARYICQPKVGEFRHERTWVFANVMRVYKPWNNMAEEDNNGNGQ